MRSTNDLIAAANANMEIDDFAKLKAEREKERFERQKIKLARQISTTPAGESVATPTIVPVVAAAIIPNPAVSVADTPTTLQSVVSALALPITSSSNADCLTATQSTQWTQKQNDDNGR